MRFVLAIALLVSASFSGCIFDTSKWETTHKDLGFPGLVLHVKVERSTDDYDLSAEARNEGPRTYHVNEECAGSWSHEVRNSELRRVFPEPTATCQAVKAREFKPGEKLSLKAQWNETAWQDGKYEKAPKGEYRWVVAVQVWESPEGSRRSFETYVTMDVK